MLKLLLLLNLAFLYTQTSQAQVIDQPYCMHFSHGNISYGWGYTPLVNNNWYWPHYGQSYPNLNNYGFSYKPRPFQPDYAAISYSPATGVYGSSWGYKNRRLALRAADNYCEEDDCRTAVWVADGCAAIATDSEKSTLGWAYNKTRSNAKKHALQSCEKNGGESCEVLAWVCSG